MRSTEGGESGSLTSKIRNLYSPPRSASWMEEMEKRSDRHIRDLVAHTAFKGLAANEIGCARISMMAGSKTLPSKGRIQMRQTNYLQIVIFDLQRRAGPYRCTTNGLMHRSKFAVIARTFIALSCLVAGQEFMQLSA